MVSFWTFALLGLLYYVVHRARVVLKAIRDVRGVPIYWCFVELCTPWSGLFPKTWWNPTVNHAISHMNRYKERNCEIIYFVPLFIGNAALHTASLEVSRQLLPDLRNFDKTPIARALDFLGPNVLTLSGEPWRRHRKITAPAFDSQIYHDVWATTSRLYSQMLTSEAWKSGDQHYFENFNQFTTRLALLVIAAGGFNMNIDWEGQLLREGLVNPVDSTLVTVSANLTARIFVPKWAYYLPLEGLKKIDIAFNELKQFLVTEVSAKQAELTREALFDKEFDKTNKNLFSLIVKASQEDGSKGLTQEEMIGNFFIYLFAGHETTAHALVATLALLALNPDEQERIQEFIQTTVGDRDLTYDDYNTLTPVLHCFYEGLRLFPAATNMIRAALDDITLSGPDLLPSGSELPIVKGVQTIVDLVGVFRNERNYKDPHSFKPRRWEEPAMLENFLVFSAGPRSCLGRKFSTVEATCFLAHILRDWKFDIKLENGETPAQWQQRVLRPYIEITLKIDKIPLMVTRRSSVKA